MIPSFTALWQAYPSTQRPCNDTNRNGSESWPNQCAIRLSIALESAGLSLGTFSDPKCSHGHARGAEPLANFLHRAIAYPTKSALVTQARTSVSGKRGIVFFRNLARFRGGDGDHIDLWNGSSTQSGEYFDIATEVWFWELT